MKCQDVRLELLAYLEGELMETEARAVKEHLLVCPSCSREFVAVQAVERDLKEGLEETNFPGSGNLGPWVARRAAKLSETEISRRREWVEGLFSNQASPLYSQCRGKRKSMFSRVGFKAVALTAILTVLLFAFWPQVVRVSAQVPTLGEWVRQLVFKDAGLAWVYEHGYINQHPETASKDGVKLSILGAVTDPIQTTIIYLLEGMEEPDLKIYSTQGWDSLPLYSLSSEQVKTPLGILGIVYTDPLPAGAQQLKVVLKELGLAMDIVVTRDLVSRVSREYKLDFEETAGDVTLKVKRLVYTPTQIRVEYSVGCVYERGVFPLPNIILMDGDDMKKAAGNRIGSCSDYYWEVSDIFTRPGNMRGLSLLICDWEFLIPMDLVFSQEDVGKEVAVADSTLTMISWERNGPVWSSDNILELQFKPDGLIQGAAKWSIDGYSPSVLQESYKGNIAVGFRLPRDPERVTASLVHLFVQGNWEIPLPNGE